MFASGANCYPQSVDFTANGTLYAVLVYNVRRWKEKDLLLVELLGSPGSQVHRDAGQGHDSGCGQQDHLRDPRNEQRNQKERGGGAGANVSLEHALVWFRAVQQNMRFESGRTYTRKEIADALGGIGVGVLPTKGDKVVCGLFDLSTNAVTHLSGEIDVYPKTLSKAAKHLEDEEVPVFLKVSTQFWKYAGEYRLKETQTSKKALEQAKKELGRDDVAAVLRFQPSKPALRVAK
jgi:hypothetical protein